MNLFYLDHDIDKIAEYHADKHVIKMPVECAQMLSTNLRERLGIDCGYKSVFINHPCTRWAAENQKNFIWLWRLGMALCDEYKYRYGKTHATKVVLEDIAMHFGEVAATLPNAPFTEPPKCVSPEFKHLDTVEAYREYYRKVKTRLHKWTNRNEPPWIKEHVS